MKIKTTKNGQTFLTVNGKRCGVYISKGPWVEGVNQDLIKVRPKKYSFPDEVWQACSDVAENNSDSTTDYFERDTLRLLPGHPLYDQAKNA